MRSPLGFALQICCSELRSFCIYELRQCLLCHFLGSPARYQSQYQPYCNRLCVWSPPPTGHTRNVIEFHFCAVVGGGSARQEVRKRSNSLICFLEMHRFDLPKQPYPPRRTANSDLTERFLPVFSQAGRGAGRSERDRQGPEGRW